MSTPHNDFEVAKSIHDLLEPLNDERRQRILRWVGESLGFSNAPPTAATPTQGNATAIPPTLTPATPAGNVDIKTFVDQKAPRSDQQFAAVVAYYYRFEAPENKRKLTLDKDSLQDATRLVGRSRLTAPVSTLNNAKNSGYLNLSSPGEFEISTVGENLVVMTLPSDKAEKKTKKKSTKKKSSKKKGSKKSSKKKSK